MRIGELRGQNNGSYSPAVLFYFAENLTTGEQKQNNFPFNFTVKNTRYVQFNVQTSGWTSGMWLFELRTSYAGDTVTTILAWAQPGTKTLASDPKTYTVDDTQTYHIYE